MRSCAWNPWSRANESDGVCGVAGCCGRGCEEEGERRRELLKVQRKPAGFVLEQRRARHLIEAEQTAHSGGRQMREGMQASIGDVRG